MTGTAETLGQFPGSACNQGRRQPALPGQELAAPSNARPL